MYGTLLLGKKEVALANKRVHLDELVKEFEVDDALRHHLKGLSCEVTYSQIRELDSTDINSEIKVLNDNTQEQKKAEPNTQESVIELGRTTLKVGGEPISYLRIQAK